MQRKAKIAIKFYFLNVLSLYYRISVLFCFPFRLNKLRENEIKKNQKTW